MSVHGSEANRVVESEFGSVSLEETRIRSKRSVVKRRITTTLRKLEGLVSKFGSKTIIKGYVNNLSEYLKEAEALNTQLLALVHESEHEAVLIWYEEQLERVNDAKLEAESHLEGRLHEVSSVAGTFPGMQENSQIPNLISSKSVMTCSSKSSGKGAEVRAKAFAAELKAKQLMKEEEKRKQELEKQLELEKNVAMAKEIAERAKLEAEERRKVQQAKDEWMRLRAEAEILENEEDNPESLSNRLRDFENEPNDKEQPPTVNQQSPLRNITEKSAPVKIPENTTLKGTLNSQVGQKLPSGNSVPSIYIQPSSNNLPRLKLTTFDGDSLKWPDWSSMFKSMVGDANISQNAKMQHLQNSVTGKAKTSIEGYGYSGDSYNKALSELESRFGKPSLVIKATLGKLRTFNRLQDNDPESVRSYSDVVSTTVWTLSRFGYVSDLNAEANLSLATYKLSNELLLKWKEHVRDGKLDRPNLSHFSDWLKGQADIYDECARSSKKNFKSKYQKQYGPSNRGENQTVLSCIMLDGSKHSLSECAKFKSLSVEDRLVEVRKHRLCFCCLSKEHWSNKCPVRKQCQINGCKGYHHSLLHRMENKKPGFGIKPPEREENIGATFESKQCSQVKRGMPVLLQVIPVTVHGPNGYLNTHAMLDSGSTCSLVLSSVAEKLGLEGSEERIILNGIQGTSELNSRRVNTQVSAVNMVTPRFDVNGALVVEHLNIAQQKVNLVDVKSKWPHLKEIDIPEASSCDVSLLIGSDCLDIILPIETRCGPRGTPVGIRTKLGWTITGPLPGYIRTSDGIFHAYVRSPDEELHNQVKSWWRTEEFGCKYDVETQRSVEDENAMRILEETTKKVDGRYEVPLLWKKNGGSMQNNRTVAERRLALLERRLQRDPNLAEAYKETIHNDLEKGYVKRIVLNEGATEEKQWYLPHHPVLNPNKPGKVRRVCDAACRYQGSSLNDHLITGPDLLNSLTGIFMRFREENIALSADIESMFSQVAVPKEDQPVLRFLWRDSTDSDTETYQYQRHIFGAKCAPTCANYALCRNAKNTNFLMQPLLLNVISTWTTFLSLLIR